MLRRYKLYTAAVSIASLNASFAVPAHTALPIYFRLLFLPAPEEATV